MSCSNNQILRKGYYRKPYYRSDGVYVQGTKVDPVCITDLGEKGKRGPKDKAIIQKRERSQKRVNKKYDEPKCKQGEIVKSGYEKGVYKRKGYYRADGTWVRPTTVARSEVGPTCVKDKGNKGKGNKLPVVLKKDVLKKYGYENVNEMTELSRHRALSRAVKDLDNLSLYRRLVYISTLNKNTNPSVSKKIKDDANWIKEKYGFKEATGGSRKGSRKRSKRKVSRKGSKKQSRKRSRKRSC